MSYFSSLSHTSTEQQSLPQSTNPSAYPRQRTSSSNLRTNSSKLSLSISASADTKERERVLSSHPATNTNGVNGAATPKGGVSYTSPGPTPLRHNWVFWFRQHRAPGNKITNYEEGIKKITSFGSVESFWSLQTHLNPPSVLAATTDYLLFHSGIKRPVWEDPLNANGGKWIIRLRKGISDRLWEDLVIAIIGDQFDVEDGICGCVLSVRSNEDIISVWNKDDKDTEAKNRIRDGIRSVLNLPPATIMEYKSNNDSMHDKSSFRTSSSASISTLANLVGQTPGTPS